MLYKPETLPYLLSYYDIILGPIYFLILLGGIIIWRNYYYKNSPLKKYIVPFFIAKIIGCVFVALLYNFYYGYSDAHGYYTSSSEIWNAAKANPLYALEIIFLPLENCSKEALSFLYLTSSNQVAEVVNTYKFSGFIGLFSFGTYMPMALIFTFLSFVGTWKIFLVFCKEFPTQHKKIAIACLFAPSALAWGGNVMKDPLCIFGLGLCFSGFFYLLKGRFTITNIIAILFGAFILLSLKGYIFYFFCVGVIGASYNKWINGLKSAKKIMKFIILIVIAGIIIEIFINASQIQETLAAEFKGGYFEAVQNVQGSVVGASTYILPDVNDFSLWGIFKTYILSLNVALFRPYLWEIPNPIAILNALESTIIMVLTFYLLIRFKIKGFFLFAKENPILLFSLLFTLALAPLAGFISFNFGTLSRYKIPVLPFYYTYLVLLYQKAKRTGTG